MGFFGKKEQEQQTSSSDNQQSLLRLLEITRQIHATLEVDRALQIILDGAIELTKMQRGFIALLNDDGKLNFRMGRTNRQQTLNEPDFQISSTLMENSIKEKQLVFFSNLKDSPSTSALKLKIVCGVCVPLFTSRNLAEAGDSKKVIGCLYADSKLAVRFKEQEKEIANSLAMHAGLALENATLFELAVRDGLTRLYQKRYFDSLAEVEWKRTLRHHRPLSVLMLDLDRFKQINDTHGHDEGDRVLKKLAGSLKNTCRAEDILARYGGDEFIALLPETDQSGATLVAGRILNNIAGIQAGGQALTSTIGIASYPANSVVHVGELIKLADISLLQAKQAGRNQYRVYSR